MIDQPTPSYPLAGRGPLPGKAVAAALVGLAYGALSVIGLLQLLAVFDDLRPSEQTVASLAFAITVVVVALLLIGGVMVLKNGGRLPLLVGAAISLFLAIFSLQQGIGLFTVINLGASVAMVALLSSTEVKDHYRR